MEPPFKETKKRGKENQKQKGEAKEQSCVSVRRVKKKQGVREGGGGGEEEDEACVYLLRLLQ